MKSAWIRLAPAALAAVALWVSGLPGRAEEPSRPAEGKGVIALFCLGDGPNQQTAAATQRILRDLVASLSPGKLVDLDLALHTDGVAEARKDLQKADSLLAQGKAAFEKLELEKAEQKLQRAWDRLVAGYGHVARPEILGDCALYLGATWALMGKQDKARQIFLTLQDLPGDRKPESQLFPPNILDMVAQAARKAQNASRGGLQIHSEPEGAEIYVDGVFGGITPADVQGLRPGQHLVKLALDGYAPLGGAARVTASKIRKASFKLKPSPRLSQLTRLLQQAAAESSAQPPTKALASLGELLRADQVLLVALNGSGSTINHRGFAWQASAPTVRSAEEPLAVQIDEYPARLREFLQRLLTAEDPPTHRRPAEPTAPAPPAGPRNSPRQPDPSASSPRAEGQKPAGGESAFAPPKSTPKALDEPFAWHGESERPAAKTRDPFQWRTLRKKWWFWSAVGILGAGAFAGGIVLLLPDQSTTGTLIIDLH